MTDPPELDHHLRPLKKQGGRVETRTILALILLFAVIVAGYLVIDQQRASQRQQLDLITLNVQCQIAGGGVVNRGGTNICVDASGHEIDLPAK